MIEMPFGKHRGRPLSEVPPGYLDWLLTIELRPWLRTAVKNELARRLDARPDPPRPSAVPAAHRESLAVVLESGFRAVALRLHPDRGGDGDAMRRLLETREWARRELLR